MILNKFIISDDEWQPKNAFCNVGVAIVGAGAMGAAATAYGASKAADAQTTAAGMANKQAWKMYAHTRADLAPYRQSGAQADKMLMNRLPFLTSPIVMDQKTLEQTPGYQFNKTQGLKGVQNAAAARGLGVSGAALKGAATFATGLADSTYQNQFNNENTNRTNAYNRLKGLVDLGENAAAQTGNAGIDTSKIMSSNTIGAGDAQASMFNAFGKAGSSLANTIGGWYGYKGLYGNNSNDNGNPLTNIMQGAG